jgi:hypothetical protein
VAAFSHKCFVVQNIQRSKGAAVSSTVFFKIEDPQTPEAIGLKLPAKAFQIYLSVSLDKHDRFYFGLQLSAVGDLFDCISEVNRFIIT